MAILVTSKQYTIESQEDMTGKSQLEVISRSLYKCVAMNDGQTARQCKLGLYIIKGGVRGGQCVLLSLKRRVRAAEGRVARPNPLVHTMTNKQICHKKQQLRGLISYKCFLPMELPAVN